MNPKISTVVIEKGGKRAVVSGPIRWDTDEKSAKFTAAIAQMNKRGKTVLATGRNKKKFKRLDANGNPADLTWEATVRVRRGRLKRGNADGWAVAAVLEMTNAFECYPWQVLNLNVT